MQKQRLGIVTHAWKLNALVLNKLDDYFTNSAISYFHHSTLEEDATWSAAKTDLYVAR